VRLVLSAGSKGVQRRLGAGLLWVGLFLSTNLLSSPIPRPLQLINSLARIKTRWSVSPSPKRKRTRSGPGILRVSPGPCSWYRWPCTKTWIVCLLFVQPAILHQKPVRRRARHRGVCVRVVAGRTARLGDAPGFSRCHHFGVEKGCPLGKVGKGGALCLPKRTRP
jgi:hypothetical protein